MKTLPIVVLILLGLVSCSSDSPAPSAQAPVQAKPETTNPKVPYSVAGSYTKAGRNWRTVVVKGPLTDSQLIALAKDLYRMYGGESVEIFDDASRIKAYENWAKSYPNPAYPYPEKWVRQHHIGMINQMLGPGGATWQLLGGAAHPTSPESKIIDLE
jgi:hypothetical protein